VTVEEFINENRALFELDYAKAARSALPSRAGWSRLRLADAAFAARFEQVIIMRRRTLGSRLSRS
jgi:hypothetical protein